MSVKLFEREGNPYYPLPPDYEELTPEGQRQARTNACRMFLHPKLTTRQRAALYVECLQFFDFWYLHPDHEVDFDPMFYDDAPLKTPEMHYDIARQWASQRLCIAIAPRGSAKSSLVKKSILLETLARPKFSVLYATSTGDNTKGVGQGIKDQYTFNERINDDFGPETPCGRLVPKRGEAPYGNTHMQLMNGSWLRCISAESKQRGGRPRLYILDDPEYDPKASTSMSLVREYMDQLLFKVVLPMVMRAGCGARWLATFVSRRHFAWHAMDVNEGKARDPRFNKWDRIIIRSEYEDSQGQKKSCWPDMWPATKEERLELAKGDSRFEKCVSLDEIKETIGTANYLSEYMAKPGQGDEVFFPNLEEEQHGYYFESVDYEFEDNPRESAASIVYNTQVDGEWIQKKETLRSFLTNTRQFMAVDTSYTATKDSDSKVCTLMAVDSENNLFVLDMWSEQTQQQKLINACLHMADRWRCPTIHIEAIKEGITVYDNLMSIISTKSSEMADVSYLPRLRKFNPGMTSKSSKIASLLRRFDYGKIKLPMRDRYKKPWRSLFDQIEQFNPEARDGGLQHDDEIDTVSMSMYIVKGRMMKRHEDVESRDPLERLREGEMYDSQGNPLALGIPLDRFTPEDIQMLMERQQDDSGGPSKV